MKLHIGCGEKYFEGWVNLDINHRCDIIDDARYLTKIENNSCSIIYASHVLEHMGRHEYIEVLKVWYSKLKNGGILRLSVPDLSKSIMLYNGSNLKSLWGALYGSQKNEYQQHKIGFDSKTLQDSLFEVGFKDVNEWDWRRTDHHMYDDFSQAYYPHMDKENGICMSLNLEAKK